MCRLWAAGAPIVVCLALGGLPTLAQDASAGPTATATPAPTANVVVTRDLTYESTDPEPTSDALDVYAPAKAGPWPVVVMFPAGPRSNVSEEARRVAELGFVVFDASWGNGPGMVADQQAGLVRSFQLRTTAHLAIPPSTSEQAGARACRGAENIGVRGRL